MITLKGIAALTHGSRPTFGEAAVNAQLLRMAISRSGKSLRQVAREAGCSATYLSHLSLGMRSTPSIDVAERLLDALELNATDRKAFVDAWSRETLETAKRWKQARKETRHA